MSFACLLDHIKFNGFVAINSRLTLKMALHLLKLRCIRVLQNVDQLDQS